MRIRSLLAGLLLFFSPLPIFADNPTKTTGKIYQIPYRLTDVKHILLRAKINGKGPFNFIMDTGAPALFVSTEAARKAGTESENSGWGTFDRFEIEGGAVLTKVRGRIEDPFQLEAMNGLGLAGAHLDGMIGYNLLAHFRIELDLTKNSMTWTQLNFDPPMPQGLQTKGGAPAELDALGTIMKLMGIFLGRNGPPEIFPRGFLGMELVDVDGAVEVKAVLAKGPAAGAGLKAGDHIRTFQGKLVSDRGEVQRLAASLRPGDLIRLTLVRSGDEQPVTFKAGRGL